MISKKTKALAASVLAATMSATAIMPSFASAATPASQETERKYSAWFESLYDDVITNGQANGYLSKNDNGSGSFGIPYHSIETCICEAPDYGHETTSEAMSYIVWTTAMRDVLGKKGILSASSDLKKGWKTLEAMIPGWSVNAYGSSTNYKSIWNQQRLKADTDNEYDTPEEYNGQNPQGDAVNPYFERFKKAYSSDNGYYMMHWLADVDDWYGFGGGTPGGNSGKFTFINTFQRGRQESCFETVPQPCIEELKYGMSGQGIKSIFNGLGSPAQYSFTNAPDAEDRAIQAVYFANLYGAGDSNVSALAGKMADQTRNDMFDKYYKKIGCQDMKWDSSDPAKSIEGMHWLRAWYTAWGGALGNYDWAWQIGCSHSHEFYQNPLAAFGAVTDNAISGGMKADTAVDDWKLSLQRQLEMYLWLQSAEGPIGGGCTNSWNGRYEKYPDGASTFYDMAYVAHPVYADPGSNHWIGNQVWAIQRLAELYYYLKSDMATAPADVKPGGLSIEEALKVILDKWVAWMIDNTEFDVVDEDGNTIAFQFPGSLNWGEEPDSTSANGMNDAVFDLNNSPAKWTGVYKEGANDNYHCEIAGMSRDIGCASSLANILIYYAKANGAKASAASNANNTELADKALYTANKILTSNWDDARDEVGLSLTENNGSLKRLFTQSVYIPNFYRGTMPDGSKLENGATFESIRESYNQDPTFQELKKAYEDTGSTEGVDLNYHRFWHEGDAIMALGVMALLYPDVDPLDEGGDPGKVTLWGDADCNGVVEINDAVLVMSYVSNKAANPISDQGLLNADVNANGDGISSNDALAIQKYLANVLTELPESYLN